MSGKRLFASGLAAGVVFVAGGLGLSVLIGNVFPAVPALAEAPDPGRRGVAIHILVRLGIGWTLAWLYAAARFRLRSTPRTALRIGLAVWFLVYVPAGWMQLGLEQLPSPVVAVTVGWGLFECAAAALLAGAVHQRLKPEYARY